jgi:ribosomal protein L37AE/L43A
MEREGYDYCPVCKSKRIKIDRYYVRHCENCKSEWDIRGNKIDINSTKREVII